MWATKAILAIALLSISCKPLLEGLTKLTLAPPDNFIGQIPRLPDPSALTSTIVGRSGVPKNVLVIGGTRGVGFGTALALAQAGARVTIVGRSNESGRRAIERMGNTKNVKWPVKFVSGDIGSVASATALTDRLGDLVGITGERFDSLVVTAAIFPNFEEPLLNEDGIDKSFGIAVVGRFVVYRNMHKFMSVGGDDDDEPLRVLNVLASGIKPPFPFDRNAIHNGVTSLLPGILNFHIGNQIMLEGLFENDPNISTGKYTMVSTHPGIIQTDLHRGQGLLFDLLEGVLAAILGISEEEAGLRQATVMFSDRLKDKGLSYVDEFGHGRISHPKMKEYMADNMDWLWGLLTKLE